jgi:hypothetical protein
MQYETLAKGTNNPFLISIDVCTQQVLGYIEIVKRLSLEDDELVAETHVNRSGTDTVRP